MSACATPPIMMLPRSMPCLLVAGMADNLDAAIAPLSPPRAHSASTCRRTQAGPTTYPSSNGLSVLSSYTCFYLLAKPFTTFTFTLCPNSPGQSSQWPRLCGSSTSKLSGSVTWHFISGNCMGDTVCATSGRCYNLSRFNPFRRHRSYWSQRGTLSVDSSVQYLLLLHSSYISLGHPSITRSTTPRIDGRKT